MNNPWEEVALADYEAHMQLENVRQQQPLSEIMGAQMRAYPVRSLAILGVAGGNGLEHCRTLPEVEQIYGVDINEEYLAACRRRFADLKDRLCLVKADLSEAAAVLPPAELLIADLFIEYIGIDCLTKKLAELCGREWRQTPAAGMYVSCVIQENSGERFVSPSPYEAAFTGISSLHRDIAQDSLIEAMDQTGYSLLLREEWPLPNGKRFLRLDFKAGPRQQ